MQGWECLYRHPKKQAFLSVYVDDLKLVGRKTLLPELWQGLMEHLKLDPPTDFHESTYLGCQQESFETTIEDIKEQPGSKYLPKSGELVWGLPMLEITTPHGIYITYKETEWVFTQAKKDKCLVWTQSSTRKNWLWIHEGPNEEYDQQICQGCCNYHSRLQKRRRYY